ncbi:type IA DNA topoisomerase [Capnocytophaga canis]|uniref:DNA topoisomerase n=1 Tax=Capnocytophaga canis TaxID=1848903 RepID=A0A0B7IS32_9FLAO|nr:type IA DNA topoisomerase [Capnocytophaga canis]CEN52758.1 DNA topoisomerase [Capnocytophaga canis]
MKTLIIAEKPSQAKEYAEALGGFKRHDGFYESERSYITWCFGHLIQMERDTAYRSTTSWDKSYLPLLPQNFQYCIGLDKNGKADKGKKNQLEIISNLMKKSNKIINATDADREGELIFLYVYNYLKCTLPYQRLWVSSLTTEALQKAFRELLSAEEVKNLGKSAYARDITDWLVGINATQSATLQLGNRNLLTIGRVQTAILKIICERWLKNKQHKASFSYRLVSLHAHKGNIFQAETEVYQNKEEITKIQEKLNPKNHVFKDEIQKTEKKHPPLLHSIDTLIMLANKLFKATGKDTLAAAQRLYENKLTTYPRTDSNYINEEGFNHLKKVLPKIAKQFLNYENVITNSKPRCVNAEKITGSHDAIVITGNITHFNKLTDFEKNIYYLIVSRCCESFDTEAIYEKKTYIFENNEIIFKTYSSKLIQEGWKCFSFRGQVKDDTEEESESLLLSYQKGEQVPIEKIIPKEIKSEPPALYTDGTLTADLTKIGKFLEIENPELLEELKGKIDLSEIQIGTQATRPLILEKLIHVGFIKNEKNKLIPTEKGLKFYEVIKQLKVSNVAYTAILEKELKDIADGVLSEEKYYKRLYNYVTKIVEDIFSIQTNLELNQKETIGKCPKCKQGNIVEGKSGLSYGCDRYKEGCDFIFAKIVAGKKLSKKNIKDLLEKGETDIIKGFKSKKGEFECKLKLDENFKTQFDFGK